jgi:hypothetical protein
LHVPVRSDLLLAGNKTHWTNESTLRLWVDEIVWPAHKKDCKKRGADPAVAKSIINIDCYPVHISKSFRTWLKNRYIQFCLVYVPPNCTSKVQFADVVLNKPFKNYYARAHTMFLMHQVKEHLESNEGLSGFNFSLLATAVAAPALKWLVQGYDKLGKLDHTARLRKIGYTKCWDDEAFVQRAMERAADFRVLVDEQADMVADNTPIDDEELRMAGPMMNV